MYRSVWLGREPFEAIDAIKNGFSDRGCWLKCRYFSFNRAVCGLGGQASEPVFSSANAFDCSADMQVKAGTN
jgi:hypothetical protein